MPLLVVFYCMQVKLGPLKHEIHRLDRNDKATLRWIYSTKSCGKMSDPRTHMGISSIEVVIRYNRLCWSGHLQCIDEEKWSRKILNFEVTSGYPRDQPKKRWFDNSRCDLNKLRLSTSSALDHAKWRNAIKPSRHVVQSNLHCRGKEER